MFTHAGDALRRITITVPAVDVDLLDRLAALEGTNRSEQIRRVLEQLRPVVRSTVEAFEAANKTRDGFLAAAAQVGQEQLDVLAPELQRLQTAFLGAMARLEGAATASGEEAAS